DSAGIVCPTRDGAIIGVAGSDEAVRLYTPDGVVTLLNGKKLWPEHPRTRTTDGEQHHLPAAETDTGFPLRARIGFTADKEVTQHFATHIGEGELQFVAGKQRNRELFDDPCFQQVLPRKLLQLLPGVGGPGELLRI